MSAYSFAEPSSADDLTFTSPEDRGWAPEAHESQAAEQLALHSTASTFLLVQKASPWAVSRLRRFFDCSVASCAIVLSLPVLLLVALIVRFTSPGPALFRQKRMGRNGVEFTLYKFRSMRAEDEDQTSHITVSGDSRITRVGSFLRRYKLDELPQFWNVLKGDMSLVGPRPKLPHHEALLMTARPGITGPATLAFRYEEELLLSVQECDLEIFYEFVIKPTKARIDYDYMRSATCGSDMRLIWSTFTSCIGFSSDPGVQDWPTLLKLLSDESSKQRLHSSQEKSETDRNPRLHLDAVNE